MQILLDTDTASIIELAATVNMLDDILHARRKEPAPAADKQETIGEYESRVATAPIIASVLTGVPPPPPPTAPATIEDVASDSDPEVSMDDDGNVTALTTSVQLQIPPAGIPAVPLSSMPASIPPPPGPVVAAELDSRGYPWDGRIHAANRSQSIKKEWKLKRGVDKNLVVACEAQNKPGNVAGAQVSALVSVPARAVGMVTADAPAPLAAPADPNQSVATASTVPPPPPVMAGIAAPAAVAPSAIDFRGLMQKIQQATAGGKLSTAQVNNALAGVGLRPEEMAQLINNAPLIASVNAAIDSCLVS